MIMKWSRTMFDKALQWSDWQEKVMFDYYKGVNSFVIGNERIIPWKKIVSIACLTSIIHLSASVIENNRYYLFLCAFRFFWFFSVFFFKAQTFAYLSMIILAWCEEKSSNRNTNHNNNNNKQSIPRKRIRVRTKSTAPTMLMSCTAAKCACVCMCGSNQVENEEKRCMKEEKFKIVRL